MKTELKNKLESEYNCEVHEVSNTIFKCTGNSEAIKKELERAGYEIMENCSNDYSISYRVTPVLFVKVLEKYNTTNFFEAIQCFAEIQSLKECHLTALGSNASAYNTSINFTFKIDFKNHKVSFTV